MARPCHTPTRTDSSVALTRFLAPEGQNGYLYPPVGGDMAKPKARPQPSKWTPSTNIYRRSFEELSELDPAKVKPLCGLSEEEMAEELRKMPPASELLQ
jgi:hypothetical protein